MFPFQLFVMTCAAPLKNRSVGVAFGGGGGGNGAWGMAGGCGGMGDIPGRVTFGFGDVFLICFSILRRMRFRISPNFRSGIRLGLCRRICRN